MTPSEFLAEYDKLNTRYYIGEISEKDFHTELVYLGVTRINVDENYVIFDGQRLPGTPRYKYRMGLPKPIHDRLKKYADAEGITMSQATARAIMEFFK